MTGPPLILVCFAMKEEAKPFREQLGERPEVKTLVTGMGHRNAEQAIRAALPLHKPGSVLTSGFAGGLNPELAAGTLVFAADGQAALESRLLAVGAQRARFHCANRVAATVQEKRALWQTTGADAVEMESAIIGAVCREQNIPSATVRIILDPASEDLPLDFNRLTTANQQMHYGKLALALLRSPGRLGTLLRFQKQCQAAANKLAEVLLPITAR